MHINIQVLIYVFLYIIFVHISMYSSFDTCTVYSGYSGHVYSGHSDIVSTFAGTK